MARPRDFDEEEVLDRALAVFHRQGYEGTSLQDLQEAMGLGRASIYLAFGDKRTLFLRAMERYRSATHDAARKALCRPGSPLGNLRRLLASMVRPDWRPTGCLIANTAAELGACDPGVAQALRAGMEGAEQIFHQHLRRALDAGELPGRTEADLRRLSRFLLNSYVGLAVLAKSEVPARMLEDAIEETLAALA